MDHFSFTGINLDRNESSAAFREMANLYLCFSIIVSSMLVPNMLLDIKDIYRLKKHFQSNELGNNRLITNYRTIAPIDWFRVGVPDALNKHTFYNHLNCVIFSFVNTLFCNNLFSIQNRF